MIFDYFFIDLVIAWLITLQCKIPVTAGPINPKLPTNLNQPGSKCKKSLICQSEYSNVLFLFLLVDNILLLNQNIVRSKSFHLNKTTNAEKRFKLLSDADLQNLSAKSESNFQNFY